MSSHKTDNQERRLAQGQASLFWHTLSPLMRKNRDGMQCERCHYVMIPHAQAGVADFTGVIPRSIGGWHPIACEVKAGSDRLYWEKIGDDQLSYMDWFAEKTHEIGWFWILLGTKRVDANHPEARQTWLVPAPSVQHVMNTCIAKGFRGIAMHKDAIERLRIDPELYPDPKQRRAISQDFKHGNVSIANLWQHYALEWVGNGLWWPKPDHVFWGTVHINYFPAPEQMHETAELSTF